MAEGLADEKHKGGLVPPGRAMPAEAKPPMPGELVLPDEALRLGLRVGGFEKVDAHHWADLSRGVKKPSGCRISSVCGAPGEVEWAKHINHIGPGPIGQWRVYLNGEDQQWFIAADEAEGWVYRDATDDEGNLLLSHEGWASEVVYGDVRIVAL